MEIREYARPANLEDAYKLLTKAKNNRLIGGCTFLKRTHLRIGTAIDLHDCGLFYIRENDKQVEIGASTSLREIETSSIILENFGSVLREPVERIIGVQLRNAITIGAHVASRYGFSDIIPTLLALDAKVRFCQMGIISLWQYMQMPSPERDILLEIIIPKSGRRATVHMMRNSYCDYSIFCFAASYSMEDGWIVAGGVFPGRAKLAEAVMRKMNQEGVCMEQIPALAREITDEFSFGSNYRGTAEYRRELCDVFARRAIKELLR